TAEGTITKEAIDKAMKETTRQYVKVAGRVLQNTGVDMLKQGSDEALQDFVKNSGEFLWDKLSDTEKAKFGTDALSPEAFGSYIANFAAGMIGGAPTALAINKANQVEKEKQANS